MSQSGRVLIANECLQSVDTAVPNTTESPTLQGGTAPAGSFGAKLQFPSFQGGMGPTDSTAESRGSVSHVTWPHPQHGFDASATGPASVANCRANPTSVPIENSSSTKRGIEGFLLNSTLDGSRLPSTELLMAEDNTAELSAMTGEQIGIGSASPALPFPPPSLASTLASSLQPFSTMQQQQQQLSSFGEQALQGGTTTSSQGSSSLLSFYPSPVTSTVKLDSEVLNRSSSGTGTYEATAYAAGNGYNVRHTVASDISDVGIDAAGRDRSTIPEPSSEEARTRAPDWSSTTQAVLSSGSMSLARRFSCHQGFESAAIPHCRTEHGDFSETPLFFEQSAGGCCRPAQTGPQLPNRSISSSSLLKTIGGGTGAHATATQRQRGQQAVLEPFARGSGNAANWRQTVTRDEAATFAHKTGDAASASAAGGGPVAPAGHVSAVSGSPLAPSLHSRGTGVLNGSSGSTTPPNRGWIVAASGNAACAAAARGLDACLGSCPIGSNGVPINPSGIGTSVTFVSPFTSRASPFQQQPIESAPHRQLNGEKDPPPIGQQLPQVSNLSSVAHYYPSGPPHSTGLLQQPPVPTALPQQQQQHHDGFTLNTGSQLLLNGPYGGAAAAPCGISCPAPGPSGRSLVARCTSAVFSGSKEKRVRKNLLETAISRLNRRRSSSCGSRRTALPTTADVVFPLIAACAAVPFLICILMANEFASRVLLTCGLVTFMGFIFSLWILAWILWFDEGPPEMQDAAAAILEGAEGFFVVQYSSICKIACGFAFGIFLLYTLRPTVQPATPGIDDVTIGSFSLAVITAFTFLLGALCSALSGYAGMWVSVRSNVRVASAARYCYNAALQICFRGGAFSSLINVALAVAGVATCLSFFRLLFPGLGITQLPLLLVGFGFGASLVAMFAQLGGGIYTKAADIGADLVGKVEAGIPEDDPRNPAVIADLVGDNVGDCAGQCADLFESIAAEIISAMILGGALAHEARLAPAEAAGFVLFPLGVHCMDLVVSSVGILLVRTKPGLPDADSASGGPQDPLAVMIRVYLLTCCLGAICFAVLCRIFLTPSSAPSAWISFTLCGIVGMASAFLFVLLTQYYTDYEYPKVQRIAEASLTGPATNIIAGLSVGLESSFPPIILISVCVLSAYYLGLNSGILPDSQVLAGLFGTAVATMGMLCTAVFVLSMSSFGPIADNAGGIVEMSFQEEHVRAITDRLDAVGNVTKANTKGFSVGSASLACFLLFSAFLDEVSIYSRQSFSIINVAVPEVFVGGLLGSGLVFLFCAWALEAVGRTAQQVVQEVRRQFRELPGIIDHVEKPDYHTCVTIVSRSALREMIRPGLLAVLSPAVVGIAFRYLGAFRNLPLLGAEAVASFLMFSTATGILMALFLNNSGGAWDNAKKYVETGALGGKKSDAHKAAVVGDTVGDPCKDTAGPSVHVLIKLVSTVTMVLVPLFVTPV